MDTGRAEKLPERVNCANRWPHKKYKYQNEDSMYPESDDLNDYLVSDTIVDWQTPAVRQKALELTLSLSDEVDKARRMYEWVRDIIPHSNDAGLDIGKAEGTLVSYVTY